MHQPVSSALRVFVGCSLAISATLVAAQQPYPSKTIRIIVPLLPGSSTDAMARVVADKLKGSLGQPVIVDNRPGGNAVIGSEFVARAAPDGYTLLVNSGTHVILPFVEPQLPFDPLKDFAPVATLSRARFVMAVHPSMPVKTVKEFIAFAKARPAQINFASSGTASASRLAGEVFNMLAGVRMQNIAYKGAAQAVTDLIGGHVQVSFLSPEGSAAHINAGRLRPLALTGETRVGALPQVPTFIEAGLPAFNVTAWQALFAPAATPKVVVDRLNAEIAKMQTSPDVKAMYEKQGIEPFVSTPEQFAAMLREDTAKLDKLIKTTGLRFQ